MVASAAEIGRLPDHGRFVALDSLRGLAALSVLLFHTGNFGLIAGLAVFQHSWLLVDFFFVLSGFVIAASYGDRLAQGFSRGKFLALRLGRVVPLHLAVVAVFTAAEFLVFRPWLHERHDLWHLLRGALLLDGFAQHTGNFFAPVSWSISVEIVLYALAALLFGRGRLGAVLAAGMVGAALAALMVQWNEPGFSFLMQRGVLGFGLGVLCYAIHRHRGKVAPSGRLSVAEIAVALAITALLHFQPFGNRTIVAADGLFALAVLAYAHDGGFGSLVLHSRPMVWLGTLSYSLYMTHLIVIIALNRGLPRLFTALGRTDLLAAKPSTFGLLSVELGPVADTALTLALLALVLGISALSWRWLEEPARQWSRQHAARWGVRGEERGALAI
ncbi:MAG: acyltransferase [Croceibacterium sp.]